MLEKITHGLQAISMNRHLTIFSFLLPLALLRATSVPEDRWFTKYSFYGSFTLGRLNSDLKLDSEVRTFYPICWAWVCKNFAL